MNLTRPNTNTSVMTFVSVQEEDFALLLDIVKELKFIQKNAIKTLPTK